MRGIAVFLLLLCVVVPFTSACCTYDLVGATTFAWSYSVEIKNFDGSQFLCRATPEILTGVAGSETGETITHIDGGLAQPSNLADNVNLEVGNPADFDNRCIWELVYATDASLAIHSYRQDFDLLSANTLYVINEIPCNGDIGNIPVINLGNRYGWDCEFPSQPATTSHDNYPIITFGDNDGDNDWRIRLSDSEPIAQHLSSNFQLIQLASSLEAFTNPLLLTDWNVCTGVSARGDLGVLLETLVVGGADGCVPVNELEPTIWQLWPSNIKSSDSYRFGITKTSQATPFDQFPDFDVPRYSLNRYAWRHGNNDDNGMGAAQTVDDLTEGALVYPVIFGNAGARELGQIPVRYTGEIDGQNEHWYAFNTLSLFPSDPNTNADSNVDFDADTAGRIPQRDLTLILHREEDPEILARANGDCNNDISITVYIEECLTCNEYFIGARSSQFWTCTDIEITIPQAHLPADLPADGVNVLGFKYFVQVLFDVPALPVTTDEYAFSISHDYCTASTNPCWIDENDVINPHPQCSSVGQLRKCHCPAGYKPTQTDGNDQIFSIWPDSPVDVPFPDAFPLGPPRIAQDHYSRVQTGFPVSFIWNFYFPFARPSLGFSEFIYGRQFIERSYYFPGHQDTSQLDLAPVAGVQSPLFTMCTDINECGEYNGVNNWSVVDATCTMPYLNTRLYTCDEGSLNSCTGERELLVVGEELAERNGVPCACQVGTPLSGCCTPTDAFTTQGFNYKIGGEIAP